MQLSLLVAAFRPDALRMHSRVERRRMSEAALAHHKHILGDGEKMRDVRSTLGVGVRTGHLRLLAAAMSALVAPCGPERWGGGGGHILGYPTTQI